MVGAANGAMEEEAEAATYSSLGAGEAGRWDEGDDETTEAVAAMGASLSAAVVKRATVMRSGAR